MGFYPFSVMHLANRRVQSAVSGEECRLQAMYKRRRQNGQAITETGPALFLLLVCMLFPLIDLLYLSAGWGMAFVLHRSEIREVAIHKPSDWMSAMNKADTEFTNGALSKFLKIERKAISDPAPTFGPDTANPEQVMVTTRAAIKPFLYLPFVFLGNIPGLTAPLDVQFTSVRLQEEKGRD